MIKLTEKKYVQTWLDPTTFTEDQLPMIVLCDDRRGFLGFIIKTHEGGNYNHEMIMRKPGWVVTQNNVLKEIPIADYMKDNVLMKFWKPAISKEDILVINKEIDKDLAKKWWQRSYDFVGLFGQALWMPWLQMPGAYFCSEWVAHIFRFLKNWSWLAATRSPVVHNKSYEEHPDQVATAGYWFAG